MVLCGCRSMTASVVLDNLARLALGVLLAGWTWLSWTRPPSRARFDFVRPLILTAAWVYFMIQYFLG